MAEVLVTFDEPVRGRDGERYHAQVCGRPGADGLWEGWLEFQPVGGGAPIRTPRETTQPNRTDLLYWAGGLGVAYLEGAIDRARRAAERPATVTVVRPGAWFPEPAPHAAPAPAVLERTAVLDPFAVWAQGPHVLQQELGALSREQLEDVSIAYGLATGAARPEAVEKAALVEAIVEGVRRRVEGA